MLPDAVCFRIAWLQFLEDVSHTHKQEYKLLDFMILSGFCPLCPFGQQEAFPLAVSEQQIGLFGNFAPKIQSVKQAILTNTLLSFIQTSLELCRLACSSFLGLYNVLLCPPTSPAFPFKQATRWMLSTWHPSLWMATSTDSMMHTRLLSSSTWNPASTSVPLIKTRLPEPIR